MWLVLGMIIMQSCFTGLWDENEDMKIGQILDLLNLGINQRPYLSSSLWAFFSLLKAQWICTHTNLEWWASALPSSGPHLWLEDRQPSHRPLATSLLQLWLGQSEISGPCHWLACHISISHWSTTPPSGGEGMQLPNGNNEFPQCAAKQ